MKLELQFAFAFSLIMVGFFTIAFYNLILGLSMVILGIILVNNI